MRANGSERLRVTKEADVDLVDLHRRAVAEFDARVRAVGDGQWDLPTPCADWDVRALVNHLVYEDRWTVPLIHGATVAEVGERFEGDLLGDDPVGAWDGASSHAVAAVGEPGSTDRVVHVSWGDIPGGEYLSQLFADHLVHAWDLARGIGADERLDPQLVEACLEIFGPQEDFLKATGMFGERIDVPADADAQTRLLAVYGRRP